MRIIGSQRGACQLEEGACKCGMWIGVYIHFFHSIFKFLVLFCFVLFLVFSFYSFQQKQIANAKQL